MGRRGAVIGVRQRPRRVRRGFRKVQRAGRWAGASPAAPRCADASSRVAARGAGLAAWRWRPGRERRKSAMKLRQWALVVAGLFVAFGVSGSAPEPVRAQAKQPATVPADANAAAKYQAAMAEWKSKILPAAKKEGEVIWYSCAQATEAEGTITLFNKAYPDIQVSQVHGPGYQLVEKINTEAAAGRVQADVYQCGGQSGRTLAWRGLGEEFIPPTALDPNVKWRWPVINKETHLAGVFASVSGLNVNTKLVPPEKFPKS